MTNNKTITFKIIHVEIIVAVIFVLVLVIGASLHIHFKTKVGLLQKLHDNEIKLLRNSLEQNEPENRDISFSE